MLLWMLPLLSFYAVALSLLGPVLPRLSGLVNNLTANGTVGCMWFNDEAIMYGKTMVLEIRL